MATTSSLAPSASASEAMDRQSQPQEEFRNYEVKQRIHDHATIRDTYKRVGLIGKGNFGKIYLARHRDSNATVAIKMIDRRLIRNHEQHRHAINEKTICQALCKQRHDNLVKVMDVHMDRNTIWIVMEYLPNGDLFTRIKALGRLEESEARNVFRHIMDLKPENILLGVNLTPKLGDLGFARYCDGDQLLQTYCGSPYYAAPEMVSATPHEGPRSDIWSCGVILYAMLSGKLPFQSDHMPDLFAKIKKGIYKTSPHFQPKAKALIDAILRTEPKDRPTAEQVLAHEWFCEPDGAQDSLSLQQARVSMPGDPIDDTFSPPEMTVPPSVYLGKPSRSMDLSTDLTVAPFQISQTPLEGHIPRSDHPSKSRIRAMASARNPSFTFRIPLVKRNSKILPETTCDFDIYKPIDKRQFWSLRVLDWSIIAHKQ